ncbi:MAG: ABC transporter permease [Verrucomicrobiota bacterium]
MSRLPFELLLALRYLRPKRTFVSVITLISIVGVALGVAVLIIVISVMSGFDAQLRDRILGFNAHIKVMKRFAKKMDDYALTSAIVSSNSQVRGVAPFVMGQALLKTQPEVGEPVGGAPWIRGIDPQLEEQVSGISTNMVEGKFDVEDDGIVMGIELARMLNVHAGDRVAIYYPRDLLKMEKSRGKDDIAILPNDYVVKGVFDVGYYEFNAAVVLCSLESAQELFDSEEQVDGLMVMLKDPFQAGAVRDELMAALGRDYFVSTWMTENSTILDALVVEKHVMFYLLFFIMIVAAFGITSALITFVVQKTREIGILKALGASAFQIQWLFLSQSLIVGVVGVTCGYGLGMLAVAYRNEFLFLMRRVTGFELFPASIYNFTELPALIVPGDIAIICGGSLLICVLAGAFPAWNAGRLKPVEALRHE